MILSGLISAAPLPSPLGVPFHAGLAALIATAALALLPLVGLSIQRLGTRYARTGAMSARSILRPAMPAKPSPTV